MSTRFARLAALAACGLSLAAAAQAQSFNHVYGQVGAGQNTQSYVVGFSNPFDWKYDFRGGRFKAYWSVELGGWKGSYPEDRWYWQAGITPTLRYDWSTDGLLFMEAGIGANVISPHFAHGNHSRFATRFNFGDHLGIGMYLGADRKDEIALRVEHFSNGGYKQPNPGVNFVQLRYSHGF